MLEKYWYEPGEKVKITIILYNYNKDYVELQFNSSLIFDFEIIGNNGYRYKYSENNVFLQTITKIKIEPNGKFSQEFEWVAEAEGIYTIRAYLVGYNLITETSFMVSSSTNPNLIIQVGTDKPYYFEEEVVRIRLNIINLGLKEIKIDPNEINIQILSLFGYYRSKLEINQSYIINPRSQADLLFELTNLKQNVYFIDVKIPKYNSSNFNYFIVKKLEKEKITYTIKINVKEINKEISFLAINKKIKLEELLMGIFEGNLQGIINFVISNNPLNEVMIRMHEGEYVILALMNRENDEGMAGYSYVNLNKDLEIEMVLKKIKEYEDKSYNVRVVFENGTLAKDFSIIVLNPIDNNWKFWDNKIITKKYPFFVLAYKIPLATPNYNYQEIYLGISLVLPDEDEILVVLKKLNLSYNYIPSDTSFNLLLPLLYQYIPNTTPIQIFTLMTESQRETRTTYERESTMPTKFTPDNLTTTTVSEKGTLIQEESKTKDMSNDIIILITIIILSVLITSIIYLFIKRIKEISF